MARGVAAPGKEDGRSKRATGRTQQFATRVTKEWHDTVKAVAERDGVMLVEVLEQAVDAYERDRGTTRTELLARLLDEATPEEIDEARKLVRERRAARGEVMG